VVALFPGREARDKLTDSHAMTSGKDAMETGFALSEIDTSRPHPARMYDALLLRHEALRYRAGVRDLRRQAVAAA